jgi:hypothetical protein
MASVLGLEVRIVPPCACLQFATVGTAIYLGAHDDARVLGQRVALAIAQHLLELSNARWSRDDIYLLAFELLMPSASVRATAPAELARCQPYAVAALVETWAEHVATAP